MDLTQEKKNFSFKKIMGFSPLDVTRAAWAELESTRDAIVPKMEAMLQACQAEQRDLTADEEAAYEIGMELREAIKDEQHRRELYDTQQPIPNDAPARSIQFGSFRVSPNGEGTQSDYNGQIGLNYRKLFFDGREGQLDLAGFRDGAEFYRVMSSGRYDPRLEKRTMVENVGYSGGYSVPDNTAEQIFSVAIEDAIVLSRARVWGIKQGNSIGVPMWDGFNHADNLFGGFVPAWQGEEQAATAVDAKLTHVEVQAKSLSLFTDASSQLVADSPNFSAELNRAMGQAVGFVLDENFMWGTGVARPIGAFGSPSSIPVTRTGENAIVLADITAMLARLHPACLKRAIWMASQTTLPQLCALQDAAGNAVFVPNVASQGVPGVLMGIPVIITEKMQPLGSTDLALVDWSQYAVVLRASIGIEKSNAVRWMENVQSFRCITRVNGLPLWPEPVQPRNGAPTVSWCVYLD
ncbi:MAG: Phage capsid family protein [Deltaproteobacteria bacterium ADurb.Bin072]|nr:MAG: Phage capsid family protein [Deltaproteobacteria bacterium ADurb.Bin072]